MILRCQTGFGRRAGDVGGRALGWRRLIHAGVGGQFPARCPPRAQPHPQGDPGDHGQGKEDSIIEWARPGKLKSSNPCQFQIRDDEDTAAIENDWKFAAMVLDRLCLITFTLFTIIATIAVLLSAPHIIVT